MNRLKSLITLLTLSITVLSPIYSQQKIDLSGSWSFALDRDNIGEKEGWQNRTFPETISLPGSTDQAKKGDKTIGSDFGILTREYKYYGAAWYTKEIEIPQDWINNSILLELERVMWESTIYIDGDRVGSYDALGSSHTFNLGKLTPGTHLLSIKIDNSMIHNIGDKGSTYTEFTQTIWNGIIGEISLRPLSDVRFTKPQIFTSIDSKLCNLTIKDTLINESGAKKDGVLNWELAERSTLKVVAKGSKEVSFNVGQNPLEFTTPDLEHIKLWCDTDPNLYTLKMTLKSSSNKKKSYFESSEELIEIGFREISHSKSKIVINGKPIFIRGNLDCVHFPLTGYPPCNVDEWERIFNIYKDYGLNQVRFHSWCPPKAAFIAADRVGIYIQAEVLWIDGWMASVHTDRPEMNAIGRPKGLGFNPSAEEHVKKELLRMIESYGNHPSFVMQCIGNELGSSDFEVMESWMKPIKESDNRRLYSVSSARTVTPLDQYMVTHYLDGLGGTRGIRGGASLDWDFEDVYSKSSIPVISHEIGQWPVYPHWSEIKKYSGVVKARNFDEFYNVAKKNKIEEQNREFVEASGALSMIMYKYEIESFLRTPSCGGIQLLGMQDYQGQGEALIGWLDVFYDSKGITTPKKFKTHHDTIVPLLRLPKFVWQGGEELNAKIQLAQYGSTDIRCGLYWKIRDENSNIIATGETTPKMYKIGSSEIAGEIKIQLPQLPKAQQLRVEVGLNNRDIENSWNIWLYPTKKECEQCCNNIYTTDKFDQLTIDKLKDGEMVLLDASNLGDELSCDKISFTPLYWSLTFFPGQGKNTIGMVVRDRHPLFNSFPTSSHSDWQWEYIYKGARAFYINDFPKEYKPIAQPIDDFHRNNKLASIFELKVGEGKLLICGFDLSDSENFVVKELKSSIINYMNSSEFNPDYNVSVESLKTMFITKEKLISTAPSEFSNAAIYVESSKINDAQLLKGSMYEINKWESDQINLKIKCPQGMIGSLYILIEGNPSQEEIAEVTFENRNYTLTSDESGSTWLKLHVMREDSNDGDLQLTATSKGSQKNIKISRIALVEDDE